MSFAQLARRLRFLPLGLLWGVVAGGFDSYHILSVASADDQVSWLVPIGIIACTCLIATPLGSAMLKRDLSSIRWVVNWMITGVASCGGAIAIFYPALFLWLSLLRPNPSALSSPISFVADVLGGTLFALAFSLVFGTLIAIESAVVALVLAPFALLGRRLILRRVSAAEPAGGASQTHS